MRTADDLSPSTEAATNVALPAPTGQQPAAVPQHLPADPTAGPRLPPRMARSAGPATGQLPAITTSSLPTTAAAAAFAALTGAVPVVVSDADAPPPKRKRSKKWIVLPLMLLVLAAAGYLLRDTPIGQRFTGKGYDHNALPSRSFAQPAFATAELTYTVQTVGIEDGLPANYWQISRATVNYPAHAAKVTVDEAKAAIIGGTIGTAQSTAPTRAIVVDDQSAYVAGPTPADAWTRHPHAPGANLAVLSASQVRMYQDVVDPVLRAQTPAKVTAEVRHGVPVTTYQYSFTFGDFYESAPGLFQFAQVIDGNAAPDAAVTATLSFDSDWVVRFVEVSVDYRSVIEHRAKVDPASRYPYRISVDVVSTSAEPEAVTIPTNVVDGAVDADADTVIP